MVAITKTTLNTIKKTAKQPSTLLTMPQPPIGAAGAECLHFKIVRN